MGGNIGCLAGKKDIITISIKGILGENGALRDCMCRFGKISTKNKCLMVVWFIIKMVILLTITPIILNVYRGMNMLQYYVENVRRNKKTILIKLDRLLKYGIHRLKDCNGTKSMENRTGLIQKFSHVSALIVERFLNLIKNHLNFAIQYAEINIEENTTTRQLLKHVQIAKSNSSQKHSKENQQPFVPIDALGIIMDTEEKIKVYNLEIEEAHCYYANKVLVGNCSGAYQHLSSAGVTIYTMKQLEDEEREEHERTHPEDE
jgi:hypothetical protein